MPKSSVEVTPKGWMPGATQVAIPASNFAVGCSARKAVVLHISEGTALSAISWFENTVSEVSAHFIVTDTGHILQCVSVLDTAYGNGLSWNVAQQCWVDPKKHYLKAPNPAPAWTGLTPPINPNRQTISIEREGHYRDIPTAAENAAVVRILQYVHEQFPTMLPTWAFMQTLIGHCHLSPIERANCPGPHVDFAALAAAANAPPPPAITKRYRVRGLPVYERSDRTGPLWGHLKQDEVIEINDLSNGHLKDGRGFIRFDPDTLEAL
jgi:N-acetyl-anhydromuramyl-L-alanine amidase AmpD